MPDLAIVPPPVEGQQPTDSANPPSEMFDYQKAKVRMDRMINEWREEKNRTVYRRKDRYIDLDVEELRASGHINQDETFIPNRVIDNNIMRDKADAMAFLNGSHRLAYFRCVSNPLLDTRQLESDFTKGLSYPGWYKAFDRHYDGAALHGWDAVEVLYDENKPLRVAFEHIGHDRLLFNWRIENIQDSEIIMREYEVSTMRLQSFVTDFGFNPEQVALITQLYQEKKKDDQVVTIYKTYFKFNNCVYVCWYSKNDPVKDWLKAPEKLQCGILQPPAIPPQPSIGDQMTQAISPPSPSPIPFPTEKEMSQYPIFLYIYKDDEQETIFDHKGRGFLDLPSQEATTAVGTGFVNGILRASNVYCCPDESDGEGNDLKILDTQLENGQIFNKPLKFFSHPYPDPTVLNALQYLDQANSKQTGKIATAVSNRKDSRKTAKELEIGENEESQITSTNLATYSEWLRDVLNFTWQIVQSQAMVGNIEFLMKQQVQPMTMMGPQPVGEQTIFANDIETIKQVFDIRAAGDIDVVQKEKELASMQQDWPVIQNTPLASKFLEDYIRLRYPQKADEYSAIIKTGNPAKQIIQSLLAVTEGALKSNPARLEQTMRDPQEGQQLTQIVQTAEQYLQNPAV